MTEASQPSQPSTGEAANPGMGQPMLSSDTGANANSNPGSAPYLKPDEAEILAAWVRDEEATTPANAAGHERIQAIANEIDDLVGNRQTLVADDMEERMIACLVGHIDAKSQINLEISRDVAQVTAEKDHLEGADLVRRLTVISSRALSLIAGTTPPVITPASLPFASATPPPVPVEGAGGATGADARLGAASPVGSSNQATSSQSSGLDQSPVSATLRQAPGSETGEGKRGARPRPIPRPTKTPLPKLTLLQRLLGRK